MLPKLLPLISDGSSGVRSQLLKVFKLLPSNGIEDRVDLISPYVRAGMTHISPDIRSSSIDVLEWLTAAAGHELVTSPGGWVKPLRAFVLIFGWSEEIKTASGWSTTNKTLTTELGKNTKGLVKSLHGLASFLRAGLFEPESAEQPTMENTFPIVPYQCHLLPKRSNGFGYLNLFGPPRDADSKEYMDCEERQQVFHTKFRKTIENGLEAAKREGGEIGRAAATVRKVIADAMEGFEPDPYWTG